MPVWLTIIVSAVASVVAAFGAYWLSPVINRQFQIDEARSVHIAKTTDGLNEEIIALSQKVRRLNDALVNDPKNVPTLRDDSLDLVTKLQWMLVDLRVVLKSDGDREAIIKLKNALMALGNTLNHASKPEDSEKVLKAMEGLARETRDVLDRLYTTASLK